MKLAKSLLIVSAISSILVSNSFAQEKASKNEALIKKGEKIFNTKKLGNCLACHAVNGKKIDGPGSLGPKLQYLSMWPDEMLYEKIYDPYSANPISAMPAFGKNGWLSDKQIKALIAYLKTIK